MSLSVKGTFGTIVEFLLAALILVGDVMKRKWSAKDKVDDTVAKLRADLDLALAEGRVTDAGFLSRRLRALGGLSACVLLSLMLCGCWTTKPVVQPVPVYGERIIVVPPGTRITITGTNGVPTTLTDPTPPANLWYIVDDVGLAGWLGL